MNEILDELRLFNSAVHEIWKRYQASGPGHVDSKLYPAVAISAERLLALLAERGSNSGDEHEELAASKRQQLQTAVTTASQLSKRCACDAAGLCFVTGEAGLIPRRDLIDEFTSALSIIGQACQ